MMRKKTILILALATLVVFGGLGVFFVPYVREANAWQFIAGIEDLWLQILVGFAFGIITAKAGWQIVELPNLKSIKVFFTEIIKPLKLTTFEIVLISVCAGIGEEMFFRGALQPVLGIWVTAILFVLLHGYLNPFNVSMTYYGIYMVVVIGVMGLFTENIGIISAMIAHSVIDFILLVELSKAEIPNGESKMKEHSEN